MTFSPERVVPAAILNADDLPTLPTAAMEVLRICSEEDSTLDDLAQAISADPALAAKLLRYSNSSLFNLGQEVTTLQRAALVLGQKSVQLMALSFSLTSSLPHSGADFDFKRFWQGSLAHAVAARSLTLMLRRHGEEEAFLCGLLASLGQLVLARCFPLYAEVFAACGERWPSAADELEVLGFHRGAKASRALRCS
jgi:HD-like signal output (HDOD) protein